MPGYDGTGPVGRGPNGRGLGPCGQDSIEPHRRFLRFGWGRGWRAKAFRWLDRPMVDEKGDLQAERSWLKQQLDAVNNRLAELHDK